jgi:hypothetical protein
MKQTLRILAVSVIIFCFFSEPKINAQTLEFAPITVKKMPQSVDEFLDLKDELAKTPNGGAACFLVALMVYAKDSQLGTKLLTMSIDRELLIQGNSYNGFQPRMTDLATFRSLLVQKPYFFNSYVVGTDAEQNYNLPNEDEITFDFIRNPPAMYKEGSETYRVLIKCNADAKPRMVKLRKDYKGFWKVYDWSSILAEFPRKNN